MSALRSLRCLTTRVAMNRPRLASNVNMSMRRQYTTAPKKVADEGHNPLLWVGKVIHKNKTHKTIKNVLS